MDVPPILPWKWCQLTKSWRWSRLSTSRTRRKYCRWRICINPKSGTVPDHPLFQTIKHPFLIELLWSSVDRRNLYLLFPYVAGGELFYHLRSAGRFGLASVRFYSAEIISALSYLHGNNIVYRYWQVTTQDLIKVQLRSSDQALSSILISIWARAVMCYGLYPLHPPPTTLNLLSCFSAPCGLRGCHSKTEVNLYIAGTWSQRTYFLTVKGM